MTEIWKDIPNYEGLYQISNFGNVKSLQRKVYIPSRKCYKTINEKILQPALRGENNYYFVSLCKNGNYKGYAIHRLLAETFIENPENKIQVNHKNGNKQDNSLCNLEWVTPQENKIHAVYTGLDVTPYGIKKVMRLSDNKIYKSLTLAAKDLGVNSTAISKVCNGKWKHVRGEAFCYV